MPPVPVLLTHTYPRWGGDKAQMVELAASLDPARYRALVLTTEQGALTEACAAHGVPSIVLPMSFFRRASGIADYFLRGPIALHDLLRRERIGVVHACCDRSTLPMARAARRLGIPFVQHVHDTDRAWASRKRTPVLRRADAVIAISGYVKRWLVERGVPAELITVINSCVELAPYRAASRRDATRARLGVGPAEVAIGVFGRLEPSRKGQDEMMRAVATLGANGPRLFLVGEDDSDTGEHERALRALASELALGDRVQFLGQRREVPELMSAMDILGAPFHREGFGRVVVEGMAAGLAVAGFRSGALPEIVRDDADGVLVPEGDVEELAGALRRLSGDPALRAAMGTRARERAGDFSLERHVSEVQALYDRVRVP